jgi:hypothetical protein
VDRLTPLSLLQFWRAGYFRRPARQRLDPLHRDVKAPVLPGSDSLRHVQWRRGRKGNAVTQRTDPPVRRPALARARVFAGIAAVAVAGLVAAWIWKGQGPREQAVTVLDPARVRIVRTPGGLLEVATLKKVEEFGWQVAHQCPLIDCAELLGKTTSEIKVTAHYTYRIPLQETWTLRWNAGHYELVVPPMEAKVPVAFDTSGMQIRTEKGGWLSPAAGPNREAVVRQLGGELARRAERADYKRLLQDQAAATVAEFAQRWMSEQMQPAQHPIKVTFGATAPGNAERTTAQ